MNYNHLTIDAFHCDNVNNESVIMNYLLTTVGKAKMKLLTRNGAVNPQLFTGSKKLPGISGIAIIETSHVSIHTFTKTKKVNFDIYSCKPFDNYKLTKHFRDTFHPKRIIINGLNRK